MIRRPVRDDSREREDIYHSGTSRTMERSDSNRRKRSRSRSMERSDSNRRKRSRSRSPVSRRRRMPCGRDDEAHDRLEIQDAVDRKVAQQIQEQAEKRVTDYINSNEFIVMVESLKRRERERVLTEIQAEVESQRNQLREDCNNICVQCSGYLRDIRMKGDAVDHASQADTILLQNKLRMEEQQRRQYEARQKEEAERLEQVLSKKRCEVRRMATLVISFYLWYIILTINCTMLRNY